MRYKAIVFGLLLAFTATVFAAGVTAWEGKTLPKLKMTDTHGRRITNRSLRGKVVIIDFWATWCVPCMKASPTMQKMHDKYGSRGLVVIGADVFERGRKNTAKPYASKHRYTYRFTENNDALAKTLGIETIPTMLIVDKRGKIAQVLVGYGPNLASMLDAKVSALLAK